MTEQSAGDNFDTKGSRIKSSEWATNYLAAILFHKLLF
jgi:hypothetical protein